MKNIKIFYFFSNKRMKKQTALAIFCLAKGSFPERPTHAKRGCGTKSTASFFNYIQSQLRWHPTAIDY
jgi:hypothetical protein